MTPTGSTIDGGGCFGPACEGEEAMSTSYDVIIIGSGAGGGTLAHHLAPSTIGLFTYWRTTEASVPLPASSRMGMHPFQRPRPMQGEKAVTTHYDIINHWQRRGRRHPVSPLGAVRQEWPNPKRDCLRRGLSSRGRRQLCHSHNHFR